MRTCLPIAATVVVALAALTSGELVAQSSTEADTELAKLSWLVGGKWVAEVKSQDGNPLRVEVKFDWASNKKAIRYSILFHQNGKDTPQYEGMYWWHPSKKQMAMLQINRHGDVTEAVVAIDGEHFRQTNTLTRADGTTQEQRAEFDRLGDEAFAFRAFVPKGTEWAEAVSFKYTRTR